MIKQLFIIMILMSMTTADIGSITIERVDNEAIVVSNNDEHTDTVVFMNVGSENEPVFGYTWFFYYPNPDYPVSYALRWYNYSVMNNFTDSDIISLVHYQEMKRQRELEDARIRNEQYIRDLKNRTHVNIYQLD